MLDHALQILVVAIIIIWVRYIRIGFRVQLGVKFRPVLVQVLHSAIIVIQLLRNLFFQHNVNLRYALLHLI